MTLAEHSVKISGELVTMTENLNNEIANYISLTKSTTDEYRDALSQGDLRENAAFSESVDKLGRYSASLAELYKMRNCFNTVDESNYYPINIVVMYSTVRLLQINDNKEYIFKLFPAGVAAESVGILDSTSILGSALFRREVGDIVTIEHRVTKEPIMFEIKEIY